jgi:hypothetical protein
MAQWYRNGLKAAMNKEVDWDSDTFKLTLHTSTYTPDLGAHDYVNDLTNELSTSGNYTSGGFTITMSAPTETEANSWGTARANSTAYAVGDVVKPASGNGYLYQCVVAGTSGGSIPTYPTTIGREVTDGTVVWTCAGKGIIVCGGTNVTQATFTAGPFRYGVISDRTPGTAATQPLLGLIDYGTDQTGGGGTFTETWSAAGILQIFMP